MCTNVGDPMLPNLHSGTGVLAFFPNMTTPGNPKNEKWQSLVILLSETDSGQCLQFDGWLCAPRKCQK